MSRFGIARSAAVPLAAMAVLGAGVVAATEGVPPPPRDVIAGKAYSALERNCAGCHQTGLIPPGGRPGGGLDGILALDALAREPGVLRRGLPDASPLYNVALTLERHLDIFNDPAVPEPEPQEVQAIRDWIADLPAADCVPARGTGGREVGRAVAAALSDLPPETARLARFVSVAHLASRCAGPAEAERAKKSLAVIARERTGTVGALHPVDGAPHVFRVSLRDLRLAPAAWDRLVASQAVVAPPGLELPRVVLEATGAALPLLPADRLVEALSPVARERGAVSRRGDIKDLAAALWLKEEEVTARLSRVSGPLLVAARRVMVGEAIERFEIDHLAAHLSGRSIVPAAEENGAFALAVWSDKTVYAAGDAGVLSAAANRDCYLTLIGVDRAGRATVLFPNEFEPSNHIKAGEVRSVPGPKAQYRFRFKDKGREQVVGVCSLTHKAPEGIVHEYERLRFTVLGDWQLFLREPPELTEARRDDAATDVPRPKQRQRRRGRAQDPKAALAVEAADVQTRTAIAIEIR